MVSAFGVFVTFLALGIFMIAQTSIQIFLKTSIFSILNGYYFVFLSATDETVLLWITTLALITHLLVFNLGYGCLGFPVAAEILPESKRTKVTNLFVIEPTSLR